MSRGRFHPIWQDDRLYLFISDLVDGVFFGQNFILREEDESGPWKETDRLDAADIGLRGNLIIGMCAAESSILKLVRTLITCGDAHNESYRTRFQGTDAAGAAADEAALVSPGNFTSR